MANTDCYNCNNCDNCNNCNHCNDCGNCRNCDYCCNCCYDCDNCYNCNYCCDCGNCRNCNSCYNGHYCYGCHSCNNCNYCSYCRNCFDCDYSVGLRMSENMIFCIGEGRHARQGAGYQKNHHAFNKQVTEKRFFEIGTEVEKILKSLNLNPNVKSKSWEDEWKKVTNAEWSKLSEIPEFDLDVVERIVGFRLSKKQLRKRGKDENKNTQ